MRRSRVAAVVILVVYLTLALAGSALAQEATFALANGESINVGYYTLAYLGVMSGWPSYQVYSQGAIVASFPTNPSQPDWTQYSAENVSIVTSSLAADGSTVTGTITIR
jgi:type IV secretory pathway protease TraF